MSREHITSTGHDLADSTWLDQHFNFSREPYEAMARWVGFRQGWHVLDAGCGSGSFLPILADQVGAMGRLTALDLAPENIAAVEARLRARPFACAVETRVASMFSLPYPDHTFDAVWNANVSQYLTNDELRQMLMEFRRVTKPGGLIAVKELVHETWHDSFATRMWFRWLDAMCRSGDVEWQGVARAMDLPRYLRAAGLQGVRRQFFGAEKDGPLNANDWAFLSAAYVYFANHAKHLDLPVEDQVLWRQLADARYASELLNSPDFHIRLEYIQTIGRVP